MVYWPFTRALSPLLPIVILVPFLLLKLNRCAKGLMVLVPFAVVVGLMVGGQFLPGRGIADAFAYMYPFIVSLAGSLCILILMTGIFPPTSSITRYLILPALFILPGLAVLLVAQGVKRSQDLALVAGYIAIPIVLYLSFLLAGRLCRKRLSLGRFAVITFGSMVCLGVVALAVLIGFMVAIGAVPYISFRNLVLPVLVAGPVLSISVFIIVFPFLVTAFLGSAYRERVMAVIQPVVPTPVE
jgi:hypothetical protein